MKTQKNYYLGLDIGTDSVGYAVTDENYDILKFHGEPAWGVTIFDEASLCDERRSFRSARRRLDRKQQRVALLQELFAQEIGRVDPRFFVRLSESKLFRDEVEDQYILFKDDDYTDSDYYRDYPTIHHLICDLMNNKDEHDVRLVYLACAWLVSHRGHFLSNISVDNLSEIKEFSQVYDNLMAFFVDNGYIEPWSCSETELIAQILKSDSNITGKNKELCQLLFENGKAPKETKEEMPYRVDCMVKLLAGGTVQVKDLFENEDYADFGSISLGMDDEKFAELSTNIGDDYSLVEVLRAVYDWAVLADTLGSFETISEAKRQTYEQHKKDLATLKYIVRKYCSSKYDEIFRDIGRDNYAAYAYHSDEKNAKELKRTNAENFSKYIKQELNGIEVDAEDSEAYEDMIKRLELKIFLPKQKTTDNRVIPCQLYLYELRSVLENASKYLPFLNDEEDGITVCEKIESIFKFKVPYFVGPLNSYSEYAWLERKAEKIYPWNFKEIVDLDASEENFIKRLTNTCTYLPGEKVLPKDSLMYHKYMVLNEINNLRINGERISVELKQSIYNDLFMKIKKVTKKKLVGYLLEDGVIKKGEENLITGIDININSNLAPQIAFRQLLNSGAITEDDVERIIERASYADDKTRLAKWLAAHYGNLSEEDRKYICKIKINDFGRLSRKFLCELEGVRKETGEVFSIIGALWNTQDNLMEILSAKYTFAEEVQSLKNDYYSEHPSNLKDRLDDMYVSNAAKRPIYRTLAIVKDIEKAFGEPTKIFVETTRGATEEQKGKRTSSRKQQILDLYKLCKDEDVVLLKKQLEAMGDSADRKLQGEKLFLYYMQLGKCMYSGKTIEIEKLGSKLYDIDHIYPQAYVKDDSILNNKVLVLSEKNGEKSDTYPINDAIRHSMYGYWTFLKESGFITEEKYRRLTRSTPFSENEKMGFINRQLTETSQSTKAVAEILKTRFPNSEVVYCKAGLVSEFRNEYGLLKSRTFNDLHHAKDAYLNIVTGNVYNMKFTKKWFNPNSNYSIKTTSIFNKPLICGDKTVWGGKEMIGKVKKTVGKNNAHFTKFAYFKTGGLFDQMPVDAGPGLIPLKDGLDTEKYGGYNKSSVMFFMPIRYFVGKKNEILITSIELSCGKKFLDDSEFAKEYAKHRVEHIIGKSVDAIEFPMGMRPWKVNTMLELDGFRVCIAGSGSKGKCLVAQPIMQFKESQEWNNYLKRIERLNEKISNNPNYMFDEHYDKVDRDANVKLYKLYLNKYANTVFSKRVNAPTDILEKGLEKFESLSIVDQAQALLHIHETFGRTAGGCDLRLIGGAGKAAATVSFSSTVRNWSKNYSDIRIIDSSVSGLWSTRSDNILELI